MKKKVCITIMLLLNLRLAYSQITPTPAPSGFATRSANIRILPSSTPQSEEMIAINKNSPNNLLISANGYWTNSETIFHQGFYLSSDTGSSWNGSDSLPNFGTPDNGSSWGDPATAYDANGNAYIATISNDAVQYMIQTSTNNGTSWSNQIPGISALGDLDFDKEMTFAFDEMQSSPNANTMYCAWTDFTSGQVINFNKSTDVGMTFTAPVVVSNTSVLSTGAIVVTDPSGNIDVCWANRVPKQHASTDSVVSIGFAQSSASSGGSSFSTPIVAASVNGIDFDLRGVGFDASSPYAETAVFGFPSMAIDKSCGSNNGRIYIAYPNQDPSNSNRAVIMVTSSTDGVSWSSPATVNIAGGIQNWMPTIAVDDETGLVNVIYYSLDNDSVTNSADTYVAYSTDGGDTWQNIEVSDTPHIHGPVDNTQFRTGYCGEYLGLASFGGSSFAVWHDNRPVPPSTSPGPWNLYFSRIQYNLPLLTSSSASLAINNPTINNMQTFQASDNILVANSNSVELTSSSVVNIVAGESISFNPGFKADAGSAMDATIQSFTACNTPGAQDFTRAPPHVNNGTTINSGTDTSTLALSCYPNPTSGYITIILNGDIDNNAILTIKDIEGRTLYTTNSSVFYNNGNRFIYDGSALGDGVYIYSVSNGKTNFPGKFIKE